MADLENEMTVIIPKLSDIGEFEVKRYLPSQEKRSVGPFIFFDEMGPTILEHGKGMDVRPHPHIGLSTLTWLLEGEIVHRDSLGYVQTIRPGEVNWMAAGRGIVHSERSPEDGRDGERPLYGLQIWMALPSDSQEIDPRFQHIKAPDLPKISKDGTEIIVIAGQAFSETSPVEVQSPTIYLDVKVDANGSVDLPAEYEEQAVFILKGEGTFNGKPFAKGDFVLLPSAVTDVHATSDLNFVLLGGQGLKTRRHMWWNFVSTSKERIEQAKTDWEAGRFDPVPGEDEFIPLPD
ncbi:pirin family protein [Terasakiella sp. A23]|uniref:pirin family protein n=1 Tax=Terasakiella sp. FCG-A23 TaxID=3080561 RepID=UPI002953C278|nr:pirin family protein [Terasakiella sp. A23]MDV7340318.1 pirin family protein [Terasakiella sp. A23]